MCYREEIIQSDSTLGDMFPASAFAPLRLCLNIAGALSHTQRRKHGERRCQRSVSIALKK